EVIAIREQPVEHFPGLFLFPYLEQAVNEPEAANGERGGWQTEIVLVLVTEKESIVAKFPFGCFHCADISGIFCLNKPIILHQQRGSIQVSGAIGLGIGLHFLVPSIIVNILIDLFSQLLPVFILYSFSKDLSYLYCPV